MELKTCCVTCLITIEKGEADCYWGQTWMNMHDCCAGTLLIEEAGGTVTQEDGKTFEVINGKQYFATNGNTHNEFVKLILDNYEGN